jgi:hypothetical protein
MEHWGASQEVPSYGDLAVADEAEPARPVWAPAVREPRMVVVPAEHAGAGQPVRELPCLGVVGPDLVARDYVYIEGRRIESSSGTLELDPDFDPRPVLLSTGGTLHHTYVVLRVDGDPRETYAGPAYDVTPCFRLALGVDDDGRPVSSPPDAIAWLVHHPHERAGRVEADLEPWGPPAPTPDGAPDGAARLSAEPAEFDIEGAGAPGAAADAVGEAAEAATVADGPVGAAEPPAAVDAHSTEVGDAPAPEPVPGVLTEPAWVLAPPPLDRPVAGGAVDVLPTPIRVAQRRGIFARRP